MTKLVLERSAPNVLTATRHFAATPAQVYAAHTDPAIIVQWLYGFEGWTMPVCENDARPGGKIRYLWRNTKTGSEFSMTALYELLEPPFRIVHIERMHLPDATPENRVETRFDPDGTGTLMTMTMTLPDAKTVEAMLATGMADGMEASYARLDRLAYGDPLQAVRPFGSSM
jgi:uncharacterized protein YndB with AHSA1/START domain